MVKKRSLKPGELLSPLPAVMVSCGDMENSNIITIAWTGIINSKPLYTYISVRKSRYSHDIIDESGEFVINLTTEELAKVTDYCGVKSGRDVDKFMEMCLTKIPGDEVKCPMIEEAPINLECKVFEKREFPTHDMFMAEIVAVHVNEELFDENGRIDMGRAGLLAFVHGEYYGVKKNPLGFFGYSIAKPKALKKRSKENHDRRVKNNKISKNSKGVKNDKFEKNSKPVRNSKPKK